MTSLFLFEKNGIVPPPARMYLLVQDFSGANLQ